MTVLMITHKFREVNAFADEVTVLRRGKLAGSGSVKDLSTDDMSKMMIGEAQMREKAPRLARVEPKSTIEIAGLSVDDNEGMRAVDTVNLKIRGARSSASPACRETASRNWWRPWPASAALPMVP
jgi:ABC-type uncharacterized transport system ATPase subunit